MLHRTAPSCLIVLFTGLLLLAGGCDLFFDGDSGDERPTVSLYADGLVAPIGIEVDGQGRLWVGEQGTGNDDSRLSVITPDGQVHPFLANMPSEIVQGDPLGVLRAYFSPNGEDLLIFQGEGTNPLSMHLLRADPTGFTPGDPPLDTSAVEEVADIGGFVLSEAFDFATSNPYAMALGPDGNQFIVDAGANAIIRRNQDTGELSVFAQFDDLQNPTEVGPPVIDAVPTDVVFTDGRFYVSTLTGFPFPEGQARIYEVDLQGNVSVFKEGFTALVDLAVDPHDGALFALQIAQFNPASGFLPETGQLLKVPPTGAPDTLVTGLNFSSGMHVGAHPKSTSTPESTSSVRSGRSRAVGAPGELFVSSLADGAVLRIELP